MDRLTVRRALDEARNCFRRAEIETAHLDARVLLEHVLGVGREWLVAHPDAVLEEIQQQHYRSWVDRRVRREPVAAIIGHREFWGRDFVLSAETLIPRPDTETLIEAVLEAIPAQDAGIQILDMGTGSGCILLTLLHEYPNATGVGWDISRDAVRTAQRNATAQQLSQRAMFECRDWNTELTQGDRFNLIVSNPPYIATADVSELMPEVAQYEPHRALDGGKDGLDAYRQLAQIVPEMLAPEGMLAVEIGIGQEADVAALMRASGLSVQRMVKDLAGIIRCLIFRNDETGT